MKFVFSFFTRLNKKKHILSVLVSLFLVVGATTVYAQTKMLPKKDVSATKNLNKSSKNSFETGSTDLLQFVAGSADMQVVTPGSQAGGRTGTPGVIDGVFEKMVRSIIGSQAEELTLQDALNSNSGQKSYMVSTGAIPATTSMMAMIYNNTPSSTEYIADVMQNFRNPLGVEQAYAQGLGFSSLRPALEMWKVFRNLAYFFFVIIFLFVGFMIMFRSKIGGQAAVTVQQALPKIVISLLLVTFSYAIAGLMVDLMYLAIYLIIGILSTSSFFPGGQVPGVGSLTDIAFRNNIITNMFALIGSAVGNVAGAVGNIALTTLHIEESWVSGWVVQNTSNVVVTLVLAIFILVSIFRVFFDLLKAYVGIFFSVIFAPLQLLLGAMPGNNNAFKTWVTGLAENLVIFPTIILMLLLAQYFANPEVQRSAAQTGGFSAPQLGSNQGPGQTTYLSLIALGIIGALPEVVKISKGLMHGKLDLDVGKSVGDVWKKGKLGQNVGLGAMGGLAGLGAGTLLGTGYGMYRAGKESDPNKKGDAFRKGMLTGVLGGGAVGAALPTVAPTAFRLAKRGVSDAVGGFMQAGFTGTLEARRARIKAEEEKKKLEQGSYTENVPD